MPHDIYSLGVVLLELGLWTSFLQYPSHSSSQPTLSTSPETAIPSPLLHILDSDEKDTRKRATAVKNTLTALATELLPARMGQKYTEVVLLCLCCLDVVGGRWNWGGGMGRRGQWGRRGEMRKRASWMRMGLW
jgi:hypothetical protein